MTDTADTNISAEQAPVPTVNTDAPGAVTTSTVNTEDWKASLPDDLKGEKSLENIKDVPSLAKSLVNAQKMLGSRIPIPSKEASAEVLKEFYGKVTSMPGVLRLPSEGDTDSEAAMAAVYEKLGRPKDSASYKIDIPEGVEINKDYLNNFTSLAHKVGLTQAQVKALADSELSMVKEQNLAASKQQETNRDFLKKEWGNAYDSNSKVTAAMLNRLAAKYPDHVQNVIANGFSNNPLIYIVAAELGKAYQEQGSLGLGNGISGAMTPDQAREIIADIRSNKAHPYHDRRSPGHEEALKKVSQLYKDANPTAAK